MKELKETFYKLAIYLCIVAFFCSVLLTCKAKADELHTLRGFHHEVNNKSKEEILSDVLEAENLGANLVRYQIHTWMKNDKNTLYNRGEYLSRVGSHLERIDHILDNVGSFVIVDLHDCPVRFFDVCLLATELLFDRYKDKARFLAVDINEPSIDNWESTAQQLINIANRVAPDKYIIIESYRGSPDEIGGLKNLKGKNWIPSAHVYFPMRVTHQGLLGNPNSPKRWGKDFTKKDLENNLKPLIKFQKQTGKKVFIGEFACVRWSGFPKLENTRFWVRDAISIFEKNNMSWAYLSFRGSKVWSPFMSWNKDDTQEYPATWVLEEIKKGF